MTRMFKMPPSSPKSSHCPIKTPWKLWPPSPKPRSRSPCKMGRLPQWSHKPRRQGKSGKSNSNFKLTAMAIAICNELIIDMIWQIWVCCYVLSRHIHQWSISCLCFSFFYVVNFWTADCAVLLCAMSFVRHGLVMVTAYGDFSMP